MKKKKEERGRWRMKYSNRIVKQHILKTAIADGAVTAKKISPWLKEHGHREMNWRQVAAYLRTVPDVTVKHDGKRKRYYVDA